MGTYNLDNYVEQPVGLSKENAVHINSKQYFDENSVVTFSGTVDFAERPSANLRFDSLSYLSSQIGYALRNQQVTKYSAAGAIAIAGKAVVAGGTGLAMTLAAPKLGCLCDINVLSITSGDVVVTCPAGVTFDGTNNTATFNAAGDRLVIGFRSATAWEIFLNNSVVLSAV